MKDTDLMPWGKYKGEPMGILPASYLMWLYDEKKASGNVLEYIKENLEVLKLELKKR